MDRRSPQHADRTEKTEKSEKTGKSGKSGKSVRPRGVADITVLWQGALLDVVRVGRGESYCLPSGCGPAAGLPFVHVDDEGLHLTPPVGVMLVEPQVPPSVKVLLLPARTQARAVSGDLAFLIRFDDRHLIAARQRHVDKRLLVISSAAMICQVALLLAVSLAPAPGHSDGLLKARAAFALLDKRPVVRRAPAPAAPKEEADAVVVEQSAPPAVRARAPGGSAARARAAVHALFGGLSQGGDAVSASIDGALRAFGRGGPARQPGFAGGHGPRDVGEGGAVLGIGGHLGDGGGGDDDVTIGGGPRRVQLAQDSSVVLRGGLQRDEIARVVQRHLSEVRHCYERELASSAGLAGRVGVAWTIRADGAVSTVTVDNKVHAGLSSCVSRVVARMRFPQPRGGGEVFVRWPFVFSTSG